MKKIIRMLISPTYCLYAIKAYLNIRKLASWGRNISYACDSISFFGHSKISIGDNCKLGRNFKVHAREYYNGDSTSRSPKILIDKNVYFGENCYVSCLNTVIINEGATFGDNVLINDNLHGDPSKLKEEFSIKPMERKLFSKGPIIIGKNVWIGKNCTILGNVKIGDGAIVGAGSVVTHNIEPCSIYAGVPARRIK